MWFMYSQYGTENNKYGTNKRINLRLYQLVNVCLCELLNE